jgi:MFS family permease
MTSISIEPTSNPMKRVFGIRDFMLLWIGQCTSMLGDQFHSIAGAWLVLKMTGDPLALGLVLALGSIPRAIFTVVGGAVSDRLSPRKVMLATDIVRLFLSALLAAQVFTGTLAVWMLYIYALVSGIMGGLFGPASMSIVPRILPEENLQAGNSVTQGSAQLIGFLGPALAGIMIAAFPNESAGVGLAIAFDALTFVVSIGTLWMMKTGGEVIVSTQSADKTSMWQSIREGFGYLLKDPVLRLMFIIIAVANFAFGGPVVVGVPYLANIRFPEGAAAYGIIIAGFAGGNLLGIILSGMLPRLSKKILQAALVVMFAAFGLGLCVLGWISLTWVAAFDLFILGVMNGFLSILLITGLQRDTPKEMLGRMMSMVLLANFIMIPISQALTGAILRWNVVSVFVVAGGMLLALTVYLVVTPAASMLSARLTGEKDTSS